MHGILLSGTRIKVPPHKNFDKFKKKLDDALRNLRVFLEEVEYTLGPIEYIKRDDESVFLDDKHYLGIVFVHKEGLQIGLFRKKKDAQETKWNTDDTFLWNFDRASGNLAAMLLSYWEPEKVFQALDNLIKRYIEFIQELDKKIADFMKK